MSRLMVSLLAWVGRCALVIALFVGLGGWGSAAPPARDLAHQPPVEIAVDLGSLENAFEFFPHDFHFKVGQLYKLRMHNPSPVKHYFTAKDFSDAIWTSKVEFAGVEVKGKIAEIELKPESSVEWLFVPMKAGDYQLRCIVPGHEMAGMVGTIAIDVV